MPVLGPRTTILGIPLRFSGLAAFKQSVKEGFELIDAAIGALQGGAGLAASEIAYDAGDTGDSNSTETTVQGQLDSLTARIRAIEVLNNDSNSLGIG